MAETVERDWAWLGDGLAIDVANTVRLHRGSYVDLVTTPADLRRWAHRGERPLPADPDTAKLHRFRGLRDHVVAVLRAVAAAEPPPADAVAAVNTVAVTAPVVRLLDAAPRVLHPAGPVDDLVAATAAAVIDLMAGPDRERVTLCGAPGCGQVFLRARSNQQWCCSECGNRARAARHYRGQRAAW